MLHLQVRAPIVSFILVILSIRCFTFYRQTYINKVFALCLIRVTSNLSTAFYSFLNFLCHLPSLITTICHLNSHFGNWLKNRSTHFASSLYILYQSTGENALSPARMSSAKLPVIDAHLHDASLLQMMAVSDEGSCFCSLQNRHSNRLPSRDGCTVNSAIAHYGQCPPTTANHQSMTDIVSSHPLHHHGHQRARIAVNNTSSAITSTMNSSRLRGHSSAFTLQSLRKRRIFTFFLNRRPSHMLAFLFSTILLVHFALPISCLDSYNDLGKLTVATTTALYSLHHHPFFAIIFPLICHHLARL